MEGRRRCRINIKGRGWVNPRKLAAAITIRRMLRGFYRSGKDRSSIVKVGERKRIE